ncbi:hypothetical protein Hdeb2414_s0352g00874051 [Helianthus debilis subsp. tardiflorus]
MNSLHFISTLDSQLCFIDPSVLWVFDYFTVVIVVAERRGIPATSFVKDVQAYFNQLGLDVNSTLAFLQESLKKYSGTIAPPILLLALPAETGVFGIQSQCSG